MHILMRYLVIRIFLFISLFIPEFIYMIDFDCVDSWYNQNLYQINDKIINVKASIISNEDSSDYIDLFIDKNNSQFRIDYNQQIFILDRTKSIRAFKNTNQLYIDNPDTTLHKIVFSIFNEKYKNINNADIDFSNNKYIIRNQLGFNQIYIAYNDECSIMDYIYLESKEMNIKIVDINVKLIDSDNFFILDEEYFKYDLRNEN